MHEFCVPSSRSFCSTSSWPSTGSPCPTPSSTPSSTSSWIPREMNDHENAMNLLSREKGSERGWVRLARAQCWNHTTSFMLICFAEYRDVLKGLSLVGWFSHWLPVHATFWFDLIIFPSIHNPKKSPQVPSLLPIHPDLPLPEVEPVGGLERHDDGRHQRDKYRRRFQVSE